MLPRLSLCSNSQSQIAPPLQPWHWLPSHWLRAPSWLPPRCRASSFEPLCRAAASSAARASRSLAAFRASTSAAMRASSLALTSTASLVSPDAVPRRAGHALRLSAFPARRSPLPSVRLPSLRSRAASLSFLTSSSCPARWLPLPSAPSAAALASAAALSLARCAAAVSALGVASALAVASATALARRSASICARTLALASASILRSFGLNLDLDNSASILAGRLRPWRLHQPAPDQLRPSPYQSISALSAITDMSILGAHFRFAPSDDRCHRLADKWALAARILSRDVPILL